MSENDNNTHTPDNVCTMEINGTTYIIKEFFDGKETVNDIIVRRIASDLNPSFSNAGKG